MASYSRYRRLLRLPCCADFRPLSDRRVKPSAFAQTSLQEKRAAAMSRSAIMITDASPQLFINGSLAECGHEAWRDSTGYRQQDENPELVPRDGEISF